MRYVMLLYDDDPRQVLVFLSVLIRVLNKLRPCELVRINISVCLCFFNKGAGGGEMPRGGTFRGVRHFC